jgi:hypothetical protein
MRTKVSVFLLCLQLAALAGCEKRATTQPSSGAQATASPANQEPAQAKFDACRLILKEEIEAIQGSPIKESKSSVRSDGDFRVSQCFYTAAEFNQSVSLAVTQSDSDSPTKRSPKNFWEETFGRYEGEIKEGQVDKEKKESLGGQAGSKGEEDQSAPPKKIQGVGDEAYWAANRFGAALYVLKKDIFIRISVGGPDNEETKINKSKALAQKALERL